MIPARKRGRRPGQPANSAALAQVLLRRFKKLDSPRALILADRVKHGDRSRNRQSIRLRFNFVTLSEAERDNRWPRGSAGELLRERLGVPPVGPVQQADAS